MILKFLIILVSLIQTSTAFGVLPASTLRAESHSIDVIKLMGSLGLPPCVHRCIDPFILKIYSALELNDTIDNYDALCNSYEKTMECIEADSICINERIYRIATSGINNICTTKRKFIENNQSCLRQYLDEKANACDQKCKMMESIANVSHDPEIKYLSNSGGNMVRVLGKIGPICSAARCYLPCFRDQMNMVCTRAGGMFVDSLLKPFHFLAAYIEESGDLDLVKQLVPRKMPQSCKYFINEDNLLNIRKGDDN